MYNVCDTYHCERLGNGTVGVITRKCPVISGMNEKIQCTGWQDETNTLKKEYNE